MIDHSPHAGLKGEVSHLWATNRPLAVTILVGLAVVAWYLYQKSQGAGGVSAPAQSATGVPSTITNTYVTENKTIVPAAPAPIGPIPPAPAPNPVPSPGQPAPAPGPVGGGNPPVGNPIPTPGRITPIIPYNQLPPGTRYSTAQDLQAQPTLTWMGTTYKKIPGSNGLLWGQPVYGGAQVLLYGPPSAY